MIKLSCVHLLDWKLYRVCSAVHLSMSSLLEQTGFFRPKIWQLFKTLFQLILNHSSILPLQKLPSHFHQDHQAPCPLSGESPVLSKSLIPLLKAILKGSTQKESQKPPARTSISRSQLFAAMSSTPPSPPGLCAALWRERLRRPLPREVRMTKDLEIRFIIGTFSEITSIKFQKWEGGKALGKKE